MLLKTIHLAKLGFVVCIAGAMVVSVRGGGTDIIMTYGALGSTTSSVPSSSMFSFDNLSLTVHSNVVWSGIGTYDALSIVAANQYGGAADAAYPNGSPYAVDSSSATLGGVASTTLTLSTPSAYFGMWWSAGDAANVWTFYSAGKQIGQFTVNNLASALPQSYFGNPNPGPNHGLDNTEAFAFINFYGYGGTTFDKIVFSNNNSSGFEYDNTTIRVAAYGTNPNDLSTLPGVPVVQVVNNGPEIVYAPNTSPIPVPEPMTISLLALVGVIGLVKLPRRLCRQ
jgi:hypothetical protein